MALLLLLAGVPPLGCGREFFRDWANQDVSGVVFEKSRDPRFRIDLFTVDPPAMARHADPYDPDRPPAPPDDPVAAFISPIPQYPDNRLLVPLEGTGYLAMLERFQADHPYRDPGPRKVPEVAEPEKPAAPAPPVPATGSPFGGDRQPAGGPDMPGANSGTAPRELSPLRVPDIAPRPAPPAANPSGPGAGVKPKDNGVRLVAMQDPQPKPAIAAPRGDGTSDDPLLRTPRVPGDPAPGEVQDLSKPVQPRRDLTGRENAAAEAAVAELSGLLGTGEIDFVEAEAAGLPRNFRPYVINMGQAFTLALINARVYQFQLEQVYLAALPVTLQRFAFSPQFIAGLSPSTGTFGPNNGAGLFPAVSPGNSFNYRTRATGLQQSTLNLGTVAAVGKNFDNGVRLLASFASQIAFNFVGRNPSQPTVQSSLPLQAIVPLLRGGGRAVTLELLTQAERSLLYQVRNFALFRQQFTVASIIGGTISTPAAGFNTVGFSGGGNSDPVVGFLNVVEDIQLVENNTRNVATYEQFSRVYKELIRGESSGLTKLQLDQLDLQLQSARLQLIQSRTSFRNDLDSFKLQIGLPPDTPLMVDRRQTARFRRVYEDLEVWSRDPKRELSELDRIAARLPDLEDVILDGRSAHAVFRSGTDDGLEELLLAAERLSLENRLDLMNTRAALYDTWRQIRVAANALKGVLNVTITNQILTPPTTTNPFAFLDQAKQFSLVLNAELPLVRLAERNNFRSSLISYQRQRRALMNAEDLQKNILRQEVRQLQTVYFQYEIARRNLVLSVSQKDQAFENIVAPPAGAAGAGGNASGAVQTNNLIQAQSSLINVENTLVTAWYQYQSARLILYRDLGTLPYDEWEAFYELFPSEYGGNGAGADNSSPGSTAGGPIPDPSAGPGRP